MGLISMATQDQTVASTLDFTYMALYPEELNQQWHAANIKLCRGQEKQAALEKEWRRVHAIFLSRPEIMQSHVKTDQQDKKYGKTGSSDEVWARTSRR